ncbi:BUD32 family EKC/KEOPS complex subunit [Nonomuraea gerenzanensis]|nr:protein kinase family protein [Nonomuraea gerenzanensis]UBU18625.1 protein kinase family protein [Nonomuraea gerenzanensis]
MTDTRLTTHRDISTALARYDDRGLAALLEREATPLGTGIGGTSARLEVGGTPVFVKRLPITGPELRHPHSTANLFGLPPFCQYGIGSPGFGAWRELAAHTMTTEWVLNGRSPGFPLLYHWRVLPDAEPAPLYEGLADIDRAVAFWEGAPGVRRRLEALAQAPAGLTLFLEHFPRSLREWLDERVRAGDADRACALAEQGVREAVSALNAGGLLHFDAHFGNVLTDGRRCYLTDFGQAVSARFDLSAEERAFYRRHLTFDRTYTLAFMVNWLAGTFHGADWQGRRVLVRGWAAGERPAGVPGGVAALLSRHSPLATVLNDFYHELQSESRKTPYPLEKIREVAGRHALPIE